jgi:hypothetical protein
MAMRPVSGGSNGCFQSVQPRLNLAMCCIQHARMTAGLIARQPAAGRTPCSQGLPGSARPPIRSTPIMTDIDVHSLVVVTAVVSSR